MKILFFNVAPLPHSFDLHKSLVESNHEVSFWYLEEKSKHYPWKNLNYDLEAFIFDKSITSFLKVYKKAKTQDVVIITGWHTWGHILLAILCKIHSIKFSYWLDIPAPPKPGIKKLMKFLILKIANGYFITGKAGFEVFIKYYRIDKNKCYDFPYLEFKPDNKIIEEVNDHRARSINKGDKIKILVSNRFLKRKGYFILLEALSKLDAKTHNLIEVSILGTGSEFELYQNKFKNIPSVKLFGWVEYHEYLEFMKQTDIYIHTSFHEPYGIPPIDAMSHGKLLISSNGVYSSLDRVVNNVNGFLYDSEKADELLKIIYYLIENKSIIYEIGKKAKETSTIYGSFYNEKAIIDFFNNN